MVSVCGKVKEYTSCKKSTYDIDFNAANIRTKPVTALSQSENPGPERVRKATASEMARVCRGGTLNESESNYKSSLLWIIAN